MSKQRIPRWLTEGISVFEEYRRNPAWGRELTLEFAADLITLGEYGAVAIVSGKVVGQTQTLTLRVQQSYENFDHTGAYAAALELAVIALATLFLMNLLHPRKDG